MARSTGEIPKLRPSLLSRLVDERRGGVSLDGDGYFVGPEDYLESIRGDLEELLNARFHVPMEALEPYEEASRSLLVYGLPDATNNSARNPADREALRRAIERSIEIFDDRLREVQVDLAEYQDGGDRSLRFRVDAIVDLKPHKGRVFFDAALNLATNRYEIVDHFKE
jgi:type VI secretion system protein ImpF